MILIGLGANVPFAATGSPRATCGAALDTMSRSGIAIVRRSRWFESAPVPVSHHPWYVNAIVQVETTLAPGRLLDRLLEIELLYGRQRSRRNAPRTLDLDLIAYGDAVIEERTIGGNDLEIPHPRIPSRAFVLFPLRDIAPTWCHPNLEVDVDTLIDDLAPGQQTRPLADAGGLFGTEWAGAPAGEP